MKKVICIIMLIIFPLVAQDKTTEKKGMKATEIKERLKSIYVIEDDSERLLQFDTFCTELGLKKPEKKQTPVSSNWSINDNKDELTGERIVVFTSIDTRKDNSIYSSVPFVMIRHTNNIVDVSVYTDEFLGMNDEYKVFYKFDENEIVSEVWNSSTTSKAVFSPQPKQFIEKIKESKKIVFRVLDSAGTEHTFVFNIENFSSIEEKTIKSN